MDFNIKLIEGVRQCPILYDNNYSLEERSQSWLMLADKLKTNEQVLKVRWHYLLQRYQQDANFRYANKMNFLEHYIDNFQEKIHNWPEFVITEEDLNEENPGEKVEFHYLMDEHEEKGECKVTKQKDEDDNCKNYTPNQNKNVGEEKNTNAVAIDCNDGQKTPLKLQNKIQDERDKDQIMDNAESFINITNKMDDMSVVNQTSHKECSNNEMDSVQQNTLVETVEQSSTEKSEAPKESTKLQCSGRCEDDIFGELVSAMLKRMDESKKKNIKKEIMNLLFS